jgi:FkbM family methyltransferase
MLKVKRDKILYSLVNNPIFRSTELFKAFNETPFGFIDIGSMGGIHSLVTSIDSITHALCFEPGDKEYLKLKEMYSTNNTFAKVTIMPNALGGTDKSEAKLYVSKVLTNTSLLQPSINFINRYSANRFEVDSIQSISTITLDNALRIEPKLFGQKWDFIKIDTQGSEWEILSGATKTLENVVAIWCEVEFFPVYTEQKLYADIDLLLREHGFFIYALYPHYRSTKSIDRITGDTEERVMWADALFFKDPLDERNSSKAFTKKNINSIILSAILTKQYDFSMELISKFENSSEEKKKLIDVIKALAIQVRSEFVEDVENHFGGERKTGNGIAYRRFVDKFTSNSSIDWL